MIFEPDMDAPLLAGEPGRLGQGPGGAGAGQRVTVEVALQFCSSPLPRGGLCRIQRPLGMSCFLAQHSTGQPLVCG